MGGGNWVITVLIVRIHPSTPCLSFVKTHLPARSFPSPWSDWSLVAVSQTITPPV